jgi:hypothetical protein
MTVQPVDELSITMCAGNDMAATGGTTRACADDEAEPSNG